MKILFISPIFDSTGYSHAGHEYILAMDAVGLDVVPRNIKLNNFVDKEVPGRVLELMAKPSEGADVCIQHCLPSMMEYRGEYARNIALFAWETSEFTHSDWPEKLNLMDEVWVITLAQKEACIRSGVVKPIKVVPHAINLEKFHNVHSCKLPELDRVLDSDYVFYTIGEFNKRKNFAALLKAFALTFDPVEPVKLVIKSTANGDWNKHIGMVLSGLKLYPELRYYNLPIIIDRRYTSREINHLHERGHCFVSTSYGEAFQLPLMDAVGFGNQCIAPSNSNDSNYAGLPIDVINANAVPVWGAVESVPGLYRGHETWHDIDVAELGRAMRHVYINKPKYKVLGVDYLQGFNYENIGNLIKTCLASGNLPTSI